MCSESHYTSLDRVNNIRNHCILNVCYSIHPYIGEIIVLNIKSNHAHFHSKKYIRRCRLQNGHHVVWARSVFVYVQFIATRLECLFNTMLKLMQKRQSSVLLSLCEENPSVTSEFPSQRSTNAEKRLLTPASYHDETFLLNIVRFYYFTTP